MSKQTEKRKIEYIAIDALKEYERNTRTHDAEQVEQLKRSITEFGFTNPVLIDENNVIIAGHGRRSAARELGMKEVPCLRLTGLTPSQVKALRIADNQLALNAGWDEEMLRIELADLKDENFDLDLLGFSLDELEQYLEPEKAEQTKIVEDEAPAADNVKRRSKRGEIWQLGEHRLMCGDSTSADDVARLMNGEKADMVFTDMPYGMGLDTDYSSMKNNLDFAKEKNFTGGKKYAQGKVDDFTPEMVNNIFACFNYVKEMFLFGADYFAELLPNKNDGSWIVWDKRANGNDDIEQDLSSDKMYGSCFELCWSKNKHKRDIARIKWAGVFGTEKEFDHKRHHPTQKPTALVQWFLDRYSKENQSIVDLFGGSGSTLIACEQLNRKCRMMELDEHYCDVIIQRWETLTGKTAKKIK